jgi:hypothetical protein
MLAHVSQILSGLAGGILKTSVFGTKPAAAIRKAELAAQLLKAGLLH